jgi:Hydroxyethylthiazole kinase, sugar kinase family
MTGTIDYLSDGERVIAVENGHHYLGQVTGVSVSGTYPATCETPN